MEEEKKEKESLSIKEFIKTIVWIFKIYYEISPSKTILLIITRIIRDARGILYSFFYAKLIDELIKVAQSGTKSFESLIPYLVGLLVYYIFISGLVNNIDRYAYRSIKQISRMRLEIMFAQHLNYLGIQNLEDPDVQNRVSRSSDWLQSTFDMLQETIYFISNLVRVFISGAIILSFFPLMIPILIITTIIKFFPDQYFMKKDFRWQVDNSEKRRIAWSDINTVQNSKDLQEISIVGGYEYFKERYFSLLHLITVYLKLSRTKKSQIFSFFPLNPLLEY